MFLLGPDLYGVYRTNTNAGIRIPAFFIIYIKNRRSVFHILYYYTNPANSFSRMLSILERVTPSRITPFIFRFGPLLHLPMHLAPLKITLSSRWFFRRYSLINITTSLFPSKSRNFPDRFAYQFSEPFFYCSKKNNTSKVIIISERP